MTALPSTHMARRLGVHSGLGWTHLPLVPHICVNELDWINTGSGNGLSPVRHQAITWTNAVLLSIRPTGTNFSEIWIKYETFHSRKCSWKCRQRNCGHLSRGICINRLRFKQSGWDFQAPTPGLSPFKRFLVKENIKSNFNLFRGSN